MKKRFQDLIFFEFLNLYRYSSDRFFLEMSKVPCAPAKVEGLIFRASFQTTAEGLHRSLETMRDAAKQATGSEQLSRLLEIVLALGNILNRDKSGAGGGGASAAAGNPAYKLASLAKLTEMKADATKSSSSSSKGGGATLLHYLAKTVEAGRDNFLDIPFFLPREKKVGGTFHVIGVRQNTK